MVERGSFSKPQNLPSEMAYEVMEIRLAKDRMRSINEYVSENLFSEADLKYISEKDPNIAIRRFAKLYIEFPTLGRNVTEEQRIAQLNKLIGEGKFDQNTLFMMARTPELQPYTNNAINSIDDLKLLRQLFLEDKKPVARFEAVKRTYALRRSELIELWGRPSDINK